MGSFKRTLCRLAGGSPASSVVMGCDVLVPVAATAVVVVVVAGGGRDGGRGCEEVAEACIPPHGCFYVNVFMSILAGCGCA